MKKYLKKLHECWPQILASVIAAAITGTAASVVALKVNDARQDIKIETLSVQIGEVQKYLIRKFGR